MLNSIVTCAWSTSKQFSKICFWFPDRFTPGRLAVAVLDAPLLGAMEVNLTTRLTRFLCLGGVSLLYAESSERRLFGANNQKVRISIAAPP